MPPIATSPWSGGEFQRLLLAGLFRGGWSAAFRVGSGCAAPLGFLAGCWRLSCGTTFGRNVSAKRGRITALLVVRLNLLEY
jgi:hypothetical protein